MYKVLRYDNDKMIKSLRFKVEDIIYQRVLSKGKSFYDQAIDSDIKRFEKIRKLTTGQGQDHTTGCLLDYKYIRNHYELIAIDFEYAKKIRCRPKSNSANRICWTIKKY